jgi:hypothetical protein
MNAMTRRNFLGSAGLFASALGIFGAAPRGVHRSTSYVQVEYVSSFSAPFLVDRLNPGQPIDVVWRRGKACLQLDEDILGLLPNPVAQDCKRALSRQQSPSVQVDRIDRTSQGRLLLFVKFSL